MKALIVVGIVSCAFACVGLLLLGAIQFVAGRIGRDK